MNFAKQQLEQGDDMIKNADHLMAEAIRMVAGLYKDGILPKPANYFYPFPNLLTFQDAPTLVKQTTRSGVAGARCSGILTEIKELAAMRREKQGAPLKPASVR